MIMQRTILVLSLVSLISCSFISNADENSETDNHELISTTTISRFSVKDQKISSKNTDIKICETDNMYLLSAFNERKILLNNLDYDVVVSEKIYSNPEGGGNYKLTLYHYAITLQNSSSDIKNKFPKLANESFLTTYIPISEAPTTCYVFAGQNKLNLICHAGMKRFKIVPDIVKTFK